MKRKKAFTITISTVACLLLVGAIVIFILYFNGYTDARPEVNPTAGQVKVACVGDSVTYGYGITNRSKYNYPKVLGNMLGDEYCVANFGVSGCTVQDTGDQPYTDTKYYDKSLTYGADIVVFMLGSNDSKDKNWTDPDTFKSAYSALVDNYLNSQTQPQVYLCTLACAFYRDESVTSGEMAYGIQYENIITMNEIIKQVATEKGLTLIDINALTSGNREWYNSDAVHPNKTGAQKIAGEVKSKIAQ